MRFAFTRARFSLRVTTLVLVAFTLFQSTVMAQTSLPSGHECIVFYLGGIPLGFVPGQTIRISVSDPDQPDSQAPDGRQFKMLIAPLILDAQGNVIAQQDEILVEPGTLHSFEFDRDDLLLIGEPGTDRLQVRTGIRVRVFSIGDRTPLTTREILMTVELMNNGTTAGGTLARSCHIIVTDHRGPQ